MDPLPSIQPALDRVMAAIQADFEAKHRAREAALATCRQVIQGAAQAIRATHRHEFEQAERLLGTARQQVESAQQQLAAYPEIYFAGFLHDAVKEYAEARLTLALVASRSLPAPSDLGVESAAYLHGLAEAVGELRRFALDSLRTGDHAQTERLLTAMDEIYAVLVTVDYPDALTHGLRRATDLVRGVTEKTRGDLTLAALHSQLRDHMLALEARLRGERP